MAGVGPFTGQVVRQDAAGDVVSPAYDALTVTQRQRFRHEHPNSYLHVTRSAADEPDADTVTNTELVTRGRNALERLLAADVFAPTEEAAFLVYRLATPDHAQLGLVCEVESEHFAAVARPHEATQASRAALLAEHFTTVRAASSPIACAMNDQGLLEAALQRATQGDPLLDLVGDDGLQQTIWRVDDASTESELHEIVDEANLFIIDGHHRAAANAQLLASGTSLPVLVTVFPEASLHLVGFHRLVRLPSALSGASFIESIERRFAVDRIGYEPTVEPGHVALCVDDQWFRVRFDERPVAGGAKIRLGSLDPVVLEREILWQIVADTEGGADVTYMPDSEPFDVIVQLANAEGRIPIFVPPVTVEDLMVVAEGGLIMPAKSTYFTPKVRSGLFLREYHELDNA